MGDNKKRKIRSKSKIRKKIKSKSRTGERAGTRNPMSHVSYSYS